VTVITDEVLHARQEVFGAFRDPLIAPPAAGSSVGGVWVSGCTAGPIVRRGSNTFLLTAAHCFATSYTHNGYGLLGSVYASAGFDGSRADAKIST
jgi:hypothetical protein